jgi:hypothetical protein
MTSSDGNQQLTAYVPPNPSTKPFSYNRPTPSPPQAPEQYHPIQKSFSKKSGKPKQCPPYLKLLPGDFSEMLFPRQIEFIVLLHT